MITKTTDLGDINLSLDVVASITGGAATECYGVVGMASQKIMKDGLDINLVITLQRTFLWCIQKNIGV